MAITDQLTTKVGPLPAWTWGVAIGGTIAAVQYVRSRRTPEPPPDGEATGDVPDGTFPMLMSPARSGFIVGSPSGYVPPGGATDPLAPSGVADDNFAWQTRATEALVSRGYTTTAVSAAIGKWLNGEALTEQEEAIINLAVRTVGQPPSPAPPITRLPAAVPAPPTAAPTPAPAKQYQTPPSNIRHLVSPVRTSTHTAETVWGWMTPAAKKNLDAFFASLVRAKSDAAFAQSLAKFYGFPVQGPGGRWYT